jgi:hypothetical protein
MIPVKSFLLLGHIGYYAYASVGAMVILFKIGNNFVKFI